MFITLTTDFGRDSAYVATMKGVILSINPAATIVDISHGIAPQNIAEGAFVLGETTRWFPADTIHVAVVDPGVGGARKVIYAGVGEQQYICPDNGLLSYVCRDRRPDRIFEVTKQSLFLPDVSSTFHGRDIMAPVAARLSLGLAPKELGPPLQKLNLFEWPAPDLRTREILGQIIWEDSFGNLVTNIGREDLPSDINPASLLIESGGHRTDGIVKTYSARNAGSMVALFGSSNLLEVAIVEGNAARELKITVGSQICVRW